MKTTLYSITPIFLVTIFLAACSPSTGSGPDNQAATAQEAFINESTFGTLADGQDVMIYTLENRSGMEARITNYGGIVVSLTAPDRDGKLEDVVLGYDKLEDYVADSPYFGALVGRFGNRIREGSFELDGEEFTLATNNAPNHLHGGDRGFDKVVWDAKMMETDAGPALVLKYTSPDGEEGYPGTLETKVVYTLTHNNELVIEYHARSDKATPVNLTSHSYFNLSGNAERNILGHMLQINAGYFTPVDATLIPTGEFRPVDGTPFDFRTAKPVGREIGGDNEQLTFGSGYDHNWVVDKDGDGEWRRILTLSDPESGRVMTIHSDQPGLQFYSGNFLDGSNPGKGGVAYHHRWGLCLETQHFPDSPNQPAFPSTILRPGEVYASKTVHTFDIE